MDCNFCENTATIFLTQVVGNGLKKVCLCEPCSLNKELMKEEGLEQIFDDSVAPTSTEEVLDLPTSTPEQLTCRCGFTLDDLSNTGRLGCSHCYNTFDAFLKERLSALHNGTEHKGKKLERPLTKEEREKKIFLIKDALQSAIDAENFEEAASLRDQLAKAEAELVHNEL